MIEKAFSKTLFKPFLFKFISLQRILKWAQIIHTKYHTTRQKGILLIWVSFCYCGRNFIRGFDKIPLFNTFTSLLVVIEIYQLPEM